MESRLTKRLLNLDYSRIELRLLSQSIGAASEPSNTPFYMPMKLDRLTEEAKAKSRINFGLSYGMRLKKPAISMSLEDAEQLLSIYKRKVLYGREAVSTDGRR